MTTMKLSFTTLGCPDWSFDTLLSQAEALGFPAIEVRGLEGELLADRIAAFQPGQQQTTQDKLHQHNVAINGFGTSVRFDDLQLMPQMLAEGRAAIDVCQAMKIPAIRVFGNAIPDQNQETTVINQVVDGLNHLCEYARRTDVQIWLEVHGDFNTTERLLAVAECVAHARFGIIWDIGHSDLNYGDDFLSFYQPLRRWIRHVHVKDHRRIVNADQRKPVGVQLCLPGEGDIPIIPIVRTLLDDGFDGYFSFEWEKKWHPELPEPEIAFPAYVRLMRSIS